MPKKVNKKKSAVSKTKRPTKKVTKPAAAKKKPLKAAVAKKPAKPEIAAAPLPTRAPVRKIIGAGNTVTIVAKSQSQTVVAAAPTVEEPVPAPVLKIAEAPKPVLAAVEPKLAWEDAPSYLPPQIRFLALSAKLECEKAAAWPYPFAKFIASLPQDIGAIEFCLALMNVEHEAQVIAKICSLAPERVEAILAYGGDLLRQKFFSNCPEMSRKWRAHSSGSNLSLDSLIEQYLLPKVDRNFQTMLGLLLQNLCKSHAD